MVPACRGREFDEPDTCFDELPRQDALPAEAIGRFARADAVGFLGGFRFVAAAMQDVCRVRRDPTVGQERVPIHLYARDRHHEIAHVRQRLDPVPLGSRQDAQAHRSRLAAAAAPHE